MSRSRFGGYFKGWQRYKNKWDVLKSDSAPATPPATVQDFDYSKAGGVWTLASTAMFPKSSDSGTSVPLGLSDVLFTVSGQNDAWTPQTVDISAYAGATVRLVFQATNGGGFAADMQLDNINLDGNVYSFENETHSFQTSSTDSGTYAGVSWVNLAVEQDNRGLWQVDQGGTPSGNTGRADAADGTYYVYAEASSPGDVNGYNFWLRSPEVVLGGSPTLTFSEARTGANIGTLNVYLEVTA
jgi:hypothetical protein